MTEESRETAWKALKGTLDAIITVSKYFIAIGVICAPLWFLVGDKVEGIIEMPEKLEMTVSRLEGLEKDFSILSGRVISPPTVEFRHGAHIENTETLPVFKSGGILQIVYFLRRNENCPTDIYIRYWSAATGSYDPRFLSKIDSTRAPVTEDFIPWVLTLELPETIPDGIWAYHPEMRPDISVCKNYTPIQPPMVFFRVENE